MSDARITNPLVEQFRRGGVARDLRLMAAQGLLPLTPEDLIELWTDLVRDSDEGVREAATKSLTEFAVSDLLPVVKNRATPPAVLTWVVTHRSERELREPTLQNPSTTDEAIEALAPELPQELAELVVINQVRLLRRTSLLEAIESNKRLNNDQRRRLNELRETFKIGVEAEAPPPPPAPQPEPAPRAGAGARARAGTGPHRGRGDGALPLRGGAKPGRGGERGPEDLPAEHGREDDHRAQGHARGAGHPHPRPQQARLHRRSRQPPYDPGGGGILLGDEERLLRRAPYDREPPRVDQERGGDLQPRQEPPDADRPLADTPAAGEPARPEDDRRRSQRARRPSGSRPRSSCGRSSRHR